MSNNVCFGIDLGTTNSCISMMMPNTSIPKIIPLEHGQTIPSCVMLKDDGSIVVGWEAYEHRFEDSTIYSVKRHMGSDKRITLTAGDKSITMSPEEVSAHILKAIAEQASKYVGDGLVKDVTITVPAHFNDAQRRATRTAGELAGLNVVGIINEPTSAGLLYGLDNAKDNQTILVYDLGGGTFDVSILRITKSLRAFPLLGINTNGEYNKTSINIIGNDGDVKLGGDDIDAAVTEYVIEQIAVQSKLGVDKVKEIMGVKGIEELKLRVEKSKKQDLGVMIYTLDGYGSYQISLRGTAVEEMCYRPLFNRTYDLVARAMATAGVTTIDHIVMVGGSTKSPIIRKMLAEKFPHLSIMDSFEPDLSVALGASISTATSIGMSKIATITDVVPMSIGVISIDNGMPVFTKILRKDSQLPCYAEKSFDILDSNMDLRLDIRQGESSDIDKLVNIGNLVVQSDRYKGNDLTIAFKCDLNGVLSCSVILDGKDIPIDINYSANLTAKKTDDAGYDKLDKGQKFFYDTHKKKLKKAGVSEDVLARWTPQVVLDGLDGAKKLFKSLLSM